MRIAIASRGLDVAPRYEFAEDLTCYNVEKGVVVGCQNMPFPKLSTSAMIETFKSLGIDVFITGAISYEIAKSYCSNGIDIIAGAKGASRDVALSYLSRTLSGVDDMCGSDEGACSL